MIADWRKAYTKGRDHLKSITDANFDRISAFYNGGGASR